MKRVCIGLSLVLAASAMFSGLASAESILLDDYSTDKSSQYSVPYKWNGSSTQTFGRAGGELVPGGTGSWNGGGFYWNGGQTLKPGDSVSAAIRPDYFNANGASSYVGLCLATATNLQDPCRFMAMYGSGWFVDTEGMGAGSTLTAIDGSAMWHWNTQSLLTLARGTGANENVITWTFSKIGGEGLAGTGTLALSGLNASTGLYFGTASITPGSGRPSWDNLTYTAVPEPTSMAILLSAIVGLLAYAWRKRK